MKICAAIVPDLIPKLYDCDEENRVFITEDVSYLRISRFQLLKGVTYPKLADQIARYMAATQFYTSEYYLDTKRFRDLSVHFKIRLDDLLIRNLLHFPRESVQTLLFS